MGEAEGHGVPKISSHAVRITLDQGLTATQAMLQLVRGNTHELEIKSLSGL